MNKGRKHTEKDKQKLREANIGERNPMLGKRLGEEMKRGYTCVAF
ncbi:MAG: hypothetical protein LBH75_04110 [Treponema sp.]|nr:hypothetical protein [Treponema sp.]